MEVEQNSNSTPESSVVEDFQIDTFDNPIEDAPKKDIVEEGLVDQVEKIGESDEKDESKDKPKEKDDKTPKVEKASDEKPEKSLNHEDMVVEVKVDGKAEKVSLKTLKENYSGKVAYDKKFSDLGKKSKEVEKKLAQNNEKTKVITGHFDKIVSLLQDERNNPLEPLMYIIDKGGYDPVQFKKRLFASFGDVFSRFSEMDDVEKELYWQREENEFLRKRQNLERDRITEESKRREVSEAIAKQRGNHGISEEAYVEAYDELSDLGYDQKALTPETVIGYLKVKPFFMKAESVCGEFKDSLESGDYENLVSEYAKLAQVLPKSSEREILVKAAENIGLDVEYINDDQIIDELNRKVPSSREFQANKSRKNVIETFNGEVEYE
jgi:hypothetical protein